MAADISFFQTNDMILAAVLREILKMEKCCADSKDPEAKIPNSQGVPKWPITTGNGLD